MCFLVGNDFLPHVPALKIIEGGIDCLMTLYTMYLEKTQGTYITNCSNLNLEGLNLFLLIIGQIESKLLDG
jgi:5'-3' exoribonuclease 2